MKTKSIHYILSLILLAWSLGGAAYGKAAVKDLNAKEFYKAVKDLDKNSVLIDVRTPEEFEQGRLKGARLINFYDSNYLALFETIDKEKKIYIYCRSGNRSSQVSAALLKKGYKHLYNLKGGIISWVRNKFPIER